MGTTVGPKYPDVTVHLSGEDGNVFFLASACGRAARKAGVPGPEIEAFYREVMDSESYDAALRVMLRWFDVT
jgi:hypothetical protein